MEKLPRHLLIQLVFGVDTTSAIALCGLLGLVFIPQPTTIEAFGYLALAGFANYLPDLDFPVYLLFRKKFGWFSHWDVAHHPIILIPGAAFLALLTSEALGVGSPSFAAVLVGMCVTAHFVHDSMEPFGFPWLSPMSKNIHISFMHGIPRVMDRDPFVRHQKLRNSHINESTTFEIVVAHGESTTVWHIVTWVVAVAVFIIWAI